MKFNVKCIFNALNIRTIKINNQNIINIENYDNINSKIVKYVIIDINKYKVSIFYEVDKDIILNSRRLF